MRPGKWSVLLIFAISAMVFSACSNSVKVYEVTIPEGTWKDRTGGVLADLPQERGPDGETTLLFRRGDTLKVVNNDKVVHTIGLVSVRPGETVTHVFKSTGEFEGACTLLIGETVVLSVS